MEIFQVSKNRIIIPVLVIMLIAAGYAASKLSRMVRPMTLEEYEQRYPTPEIPAPFFVR